eukprot:gene10316-7034_t
MRSRLNGSALLRTASHRTLARRALVTIHSSEVAATAAQCKDGILPPIVALESTIVAHGMPFPQNLSTADDVEAVVRQHGATPATIAIIRGNVHVGLEQAELQLLAEEGAESFTKVSRRDLAACVARERNGATTVSGTGGEVTFDESADLAELGKTCTAVVCAGAKSILDIPRTLERLETLGVAVVGYQTDEFPAFFTPHSGCGAHHRADTPEECADLILASRELGLEGGILFAVPIPADAAADGERIEAAIQQALAEADEEKVAGKAITPFVLARVNQLTEGASLKANIALVKNNAQVGAEMAVALTNLSSIKLDPPGLRGGMSNASFGDGLSNASFGDLLEGSAHTTERSPEVVVLGGLVLDVISMPSPSSGGSMAAGTSNPGIVKQSLGGVGKNIAECAGRVTPSTPPLLISAVGGDSGADALVAGCRQAGLPSYGVVVMSEHRSAVYNAIHGADGDLLYGVADMDVFEALSWQQVYEQNKLALDEAKLIVCDGNMSVNALQGLQEHSSATEIPVWFEPTSFAKCTRAMDSGLFSAMATTFTSPNAHELIIMANRLYGTSPDLPAITSVEHAEEVLTPYIGALNDAGVSHVLVSLGEHGVLHGASGKQPIHYPANAIPEGQIVNTNGAGDSFVGASAALLGGGATLERAIEAGLAAAAMSCQSPHAVSPVPYYMW